MTKTSVLVIGGGAAGIVAAISAKRKGKDAIICDRMPKLGKKILASGNGRCNLSNEKLDESFYNKVSSKLARSVFAEFGGVAILNFFKELGLETYSEEGRIFPVTNQSSSVLKVLEMELERLSIPVELSFEVCRVSRSNEGFVVISKDGRKIECSKLIMAGGGKSYPALGSDGSCYRIAEELGHKIVDPVPAAVALVVKDRICHILQGQKIFAAVKVVIDKKGVCSSKGDLLFTKYGLSGSSILDVSEEISIAINRHKKNNVFISVDMVPFMEEDALEREIEKRIKLIMKPEDLMAGIFPNKFGPVFKDRFNKADPKGIVKELKNRSFKVIGTRGWNEAEFTSGGVDISAVKERTLESVLVNGLYFAGEVLDVCGCRGGYNLAWAWASGFVAGLTG